MNQLQIVRVREIDNNTTIMMRHTDFNTDDRSLPPVCRQTVDRLQCVLDGEIPCSALDSDPHPLSCSACRERIAAAKLLISALSLPAEAIAVSRGLTDKIVASILDERKAEHRSYIRRRILTSVGGLAIAAGVLITIWLRWFDSSRQNELAQNPEAANTQQANSPTNTPPEPHQAPAPRPVRLGEEFSKAEQAFLDSSRPITEPAAVAPQVLFKLTDALTSSADPTSEFEPMRISLIDLPQAAQAGLQPVTTTAQKAFARLMHDVGAVPSTMKPN